VLARVAAMAVAAALAVTVTATGAIATDITLPSTVSANPANWTPTVRDSAAIPDSAVYAIEQSGATMFVGGHFDTVAAPKATTTIARRSLFSFDAASGALRGLSDSFDGDVWALAPSGSTLFVGGTFKTVDGVSRRGLVRINATTGAVDRSFDARLGGNVTQVRLVNGRLIVSGSFPGKIKALDPATGADTGYITAAVTGTVASNAGPTEVYRFSVSPAGTRLVGVGNFTSVAGKHRMRAFMLDLGSRAASLDPWYYQPLDNACHAAKLPDQLRDVDFAPSGRFFVIVATGYVPATTAGINRDICDVAVRFETNIPHPTRPTWFNYTGGDTFHSVAVAGNDVYVQGHFRWLDNPQGRDSCGPGCVPRSGIGDINASTGLATSWNPGKDRGVGGKDLTVTSAGLWVGSDTVHIGGESHQDLGLFPEP
jgi:beta-propeller uncharacterized protein DUF5122